MNLGTAGAILSYALELEAKTDQFYEKVLREELDPHIRGTLEEIRKQHRKITKTLDRMRKENVTEMILEPIHDHDSDDYVIIVPESTSVGDVLSISRHIEEILGKFLLASAEKVSFLPELSQMLGDLAKRTGGNLESLLGSA